MANTGKTFTLFGNWQDISVHDENPGLVLLQLKELFWKLQLLKKRNIRIKLSFIEIYDNKVYDLLSEDTHQLMLIEDPKKGLIILNICL